MVKAVYQIELKDGRIFRVYCDNSHQVKRLLHGYTFIKHLCKEFKVITNGIHTLKQWEQISETLKLEQ